MIDINQIKSMAELRRALQLFVATLYNNEETAMEVATLYPVWAADKQYKANDVLQYGTNSVGDPQLYLVLQAHTSQADWLPDATTSLYKKIGISTTGYPIWVQPIGAVDAYNEGDIVSYNDKLYKSLINANVWSPDAYPTGWEEYKESSGGDSSETDTDTPSTDDDIPDFVQPTGAHDAYAKGDKVKFEGKVYESLIDANTYSPTAYPAGWQEVTTE